MRPEKPRLYQPGATAAAWDLSILGGPLDEASLAIPPLNQGGGVLCRLVGDQIPEPRVFSSFLALHPSFKGNTATTYLTQVSRYLADWLLDFGDLPAKFAPIAAASQIAARYLDAETSLPRDGTRAFDAEGAYARLERECAKLWVVARSDAPRASRRMQVRPLDVVPCGRKASRVAHLPRVEISRGEQQVLGWILHRYDALIDGEFWSHVLSERSIGEALRCYRDVTFRRERGDLPLSSATMCLRMTALEHFREALTREYSISIPEKKLRKPRVGERYRPVVEPSELEVVSSHLALVRARDSSYLACRDELIFELLYTTGMRVSALLGVRPADISFTKGVVRIQEKGDKVRELPLFSATQRKLASFLTARTNHLTKTGAASDLESPLFHSRSGKSLTRSWVFAILDSIGKRAGIERGLGPHTIRRSMACALYDNGAPLHAIQQLLGHRSPLTTARYLGHGTRNVGQVLRAYHPWSEHRSDGRLARSSVKPIKTTFSARGREPESTAKLRVQSAPAKVREDPGYLQALVQGHRNSPTIAHTFADGEVGLRPATRKNYETDLKHFIAERLHDLEFPFECVSFHRAVLTHQLADRLDWFIRTGVISERSGAKLFEWLESLQKRTPPLLSRPHEKIQGLSQLLAGVHESTDGKKLQLRLPMILRQDSDKGRGKRVELLVRGVLAGTRDEDAHDVWREIFNTDKTRQIFDEAFLRGAQASSLQRRASSLAAFGRIALRKYGIATEDGASVVVLPPLRTRSVPRPQKILTVNEVETVLRYLEAVCRSTKGLNRSIAWRNAAIFTLLYSTAMRVGALTSLRWRDIDLRRGFVYAREKGGREVEMPLLPEAIRALTQCQTDDSKGDASVFRAPRGGVLTSKQVERILTGVITKAGVEVRMRGTPSIGAHTLRRSAAVHLANNGASLFDLQKLLGHRTLVDTSRYVMHGAVETRELIQSCLPRFFSLGDEGS